MKTPIRFSFSAFPLFSLLAAATLLLCGRAPAQTWRSLNWKLNDYTLNSSNALASNLLAGTGISIAKDAKGRLTFSTTSSGEYLVESVFTNATHFGLLASKALGTNRLRTLSPGHGLTFTNQSTNLVAAIDPNVVALQTDITLTVWTATSNANWAASNLTWVLNTKLNNTNGFSYNQTNATSASNTVPLTVQGATGQTNNLLDFRDAAGNLIARITTNGFLVSTGVVFKTDETTGMRFVSGNGIQIYNGNSTVDFRSGGIANNGVSGEAYVQIYNSPIYGNSTRGNNVLMFRNGTAAYTNQIFGSYTNVSNAYWLEEGHDNNGSFNFVRSMGNGAGRARPLFLSVSNLLTSTVALTAGGVGVGKTNPASALDVNGTVTSSAVALPGGDVQTQINTLTAAVAAVPVFPRLPTTSISGLSGWLPSGSLNNLSLSGKRFIRFTVGDLTGDWLITGIDSSGCLEGEFLILFNATGYIMTVAHDSASSTSANRFKFTTAMADQSLGAGYAWMFIYDSAVIGWVPVSTPYVIP